MKTKTIALLAVSMLALAACKGAKDADAPVAPANVTEVTAPENFANVATTAPPASRIDNSATAITAPPPAATLTPDEQTQDYADATGMTSRARRDEPGNEAQPAN